MEPPCGSTIPAVSIGFSKRPDPRKLPQHRLWTLWKGGHVVRATTRQVPLGTELMIFSRDDILWSRILRDSRHIGVVADEELKDWEARGYRACPVCAGEGWSCEDHADQRRGHTLEDVTACGGAGMPCGYAGCPDSGRRDFDRLTASTSKE